MNNEDYQTSVSKIASPTYEYFSNLRWHGFITLLVSLVWTVTSLSVLLFNAPLLQSAVVMILGYLVARLSDAFSESSGEQLKTGIYPDICRHNLEHKGCCSECGEQTEDGYKIISYNVMHFMNYELVRSSRTENIVCSECETSMVSERVKDSEKDYKLELETSS